MLAYSFPSDAGSKGVKPRGLPRKLARELCSLARVQGMTEGFDTFHWVLFRCKKCGMGRDNYAHKREEEEEEGSVSDGVLAEMDEDEDGDPAVSEEEKEGEDKWE